MRIYLLLFIYYIIAICFFGHFQERYSMPVMVCFIIPLTGFFVSQFKIRHLQGRLEKAVKSLIIVMFLTIWIFQTRAALKDTERLGNAIELLKEGTGRDTDNLLK